MEINEVVGAMQIVELSSNTRRPAIFELAQAIDWGAECVSSDDLVRAIEEREATAQTIVAEGLALPHATIDWEGDFRIVFGRSQSGVNYGAAGDLVQLIVLLVIGTGRERIHLNLLSRVAELLEPYEFRRQIVAARDAHTIQQLLRARAGLHPEQRGQPETEPQLNTLLLQQAVQLALSLQAQAILLVADRCQSVSAEALLSWTGRLLVVTESSDDLLRDRRDTYLFDIPRGDLSRMDRANLGLLLAASRGLVHYEGDIVCVTGLRGKRLDCITVTEAPAHFRHIFSGNGRQGLLRVRPAVLLRILSLAVELAAEGREGHPVGAIFAVGDASHVVRHTQQLVLNPFHGFSRQLRNVTDPSLTETIKEFAALDGAFVIQADGTALSAGAYLVPKSSVTDLPAGLGARHQAAAAITAQTRAVAITVSQSTGTVSMFQNGGIVLKLERAARTSW